MASYFSAANRSAALAREWLEEMREGTSKDGHDQMPLRKVLWRHRDDEVFDLPVASSAAARTAHHVARRAIFTTIRPYSGTRCAWTG